MLRYERSLPHLLSLSKWVDNFGVAVSVGRLSAMLQAFERGVLSMARTELFGVDQIQEATDFVLYARDGHYIRASCL